VTPLSSRGDARVRHPSLKAAAESCFAHPSEQLLATLLNLYGIEWQYEPLEFPLAWNEAGRPVRAFRPDFYLPTQSLFIELTVLEQRLVTKKNQKVREFRALYPEVQLLVVYQRDFVELLRQHDLEPWVTSRPSVALVSDRRPFLYNTHVELGAKIVPFGDGKCPSPTDRAPWPSTWPVDATRWSLTCRT